MQLTPPAGTGHNRAPTIRERFPQLMPRRPYCSDDLERDGLMVRNQNVALRHRHVSFDGPHAFGWLKFDCDQPDAYFAARDANLLQPNATVINRENGHGHLLYALETPVLRTSAAHVAPLRYFASVERGMRKRLQADPRYSGLIAKNPRHADWRVEWGAPDPYTLDELADWLFEADTKFDPRPQAAIGAGRNVTAFDDLRAFAYREVRAFKRTGDEQGFKARLLQVAMGINAQFPDALPFSEIRSIARSVGKWVWRRFSLDGFSRVQSRRGRAGSVKRWANHVPVEATKPWETEGISRATYYRRRRL